MMKNSTARAKKPAKKKPKQEEKDPMKSRSKSRGICEMQIPSCMPKKKYFGRTRNFLGNLGAFIRWVYKDIIG